MKELTLTAIARTMPTSSRRLPFVMGMSLSAAAGS